MAHGHLGWDERARVRWIEQGIALSLRREAEDWYRTWQASTGHEVLTVARDFMRALRRSG